MPRNDGSLKQLPHQVAGSMNTSHPQPHETNNQYQATSDQPPDNNNSHHSNNNRSSEVDGATATPRGPTNGQHNTLQPPASSKFRCYLCETPKHEYSLIRSFSEIVCRSCLNYEGPERVEQLILDARRDKGGGASKPDFGGSASNGGCLDATAVGSRCLAPYTRQPKGSAGGRLPLPPPMASSNALTGSYQLGKSELNSLLTQTEQAFTTAASRHRWPHSTPSTSLPVPLDTGDFHTTEVAKKRRAELLSTKTLAPLPVESSMSVAATMGGDKCQTSSLTPKLTWKNNELEHNSSKSTHDRNQNHQQPPVEQRSISLGQTTAAAAAMGGPHQQQPCRSASTSLGLYAHQYLPSQPIYTPHYQTVGSPILAANASSGHQAGLHQETMASGNTSGSLSPAVSTSPVGGGTGTGSAKKDPPSTAASIGLANPTQQHMQASTQPPPPPPPPPQLPSHPLPYPLNLPLMMRSLGSSSASTCDQYAREQQQQQQVAAYEFFMSQQRNHLAAHEAVASHQLYTSHHHHHQQQLDTGGAKVSPTSRSRATLGALRCGGQLAPIPLPVPPQPPSQATAPSHTKQSLNAANLYQHTNGSPYGSLMSPYMSQLADINYGCPISYPQHHHHPSASTMGSMLAANRPPPTYGNILTSATVPPPPTSSINNNNNNTSMMMDPARHKGSSSSSLNGGSASTMSASGDESAALPASTYDFHHHRHHLMDPSFFARHLIQNESFHQQIQQMARRHQFQSPATNTRNHHRPQPPPPATLNNNNDGGGGGGGEGCQETIDRNGSISSQSQSPTPEIATANQTCRANSNQEDSNTLVPNTETTLRLLLNQDATPGPQLANGAYRPMTGRGKEPEMANRDNSLGGLSSAAAAAGSKFSPGGSTILNHNHNPNKAFQLGPVSAPIAKRRYNLEEISPPPPPKAFKQSTQRQKQKQMQEQASKRNLSSLQSKQQPILINDDDDDDDEYELGMDDLEVNLTTNNKPQTYSNTSLHQSSHAKVSRQLNSGDGESNNNNKSLPTLDSMVGGSPPEVATATDHTQSSQANRNYSLRSQSSNSQLTSSDIAGHTEPNASPPKLTSSSLSTGGSGGVSGKTTNGFAGDTRQTEQSGAGGRFKYSHNSNNSSTNQSTVGSGQPTSGAGANSTPASQLNPSFDQLKCLLCQERLEDRHFVQCPTVPLHKFCFACSKVSIKRQRKSNQESKSIEDKIFCPSGKKCLLANERSPWTFMNNEIETIFRESSRVPPQPVGAGATVGKAPPELITTNNKHSKELNHFDKGPTKGSGGGGGLKNGSSNSLDATSSNSMVETNHLPSDKKNSSDNRHAPSSKQ